MEGVPLVQLVNSNLYKTNGSIKVDSILGYNPRYYAWKSNIDRIHGAFTTTLQDWVAPVMILSCIVRLALFLLVLLLLGLSSRLILILWIIFLLLRLILLGRLINFWLILMLDVRLFVLCPVMVFLIKFVCL